MSCLDVLNEKEREVLASAVYGKRHFFWIGSGFSYNFGYPDWGQVLAKVQENLKYEGKLPKNYLHAAEILHSFYDELEDGGEFNLEVVDALYEIKEEKEIPVWVDSFKSLSSNTIVTTNWDSVLEEIFDYLTSVVIRGDKNIQISDGRNIFKIHGDAAIPENIVVTQSQYTRFQREDTYLKSKIFTMFSENIPIFLGYSLTDPNVFYIYDEVIAHLGDDKSPSFMIVHPSDDPDKFKQAKYLFSKKNICLIEAKIEDFLDDLSMLVEDFSDALNGYKYDFKDVLPRVEIMLEKAVQGKKATKEEVAEFKTDEGRTLAISALLKMFDNPQIFKDYGGELYVKSGTISAVSANALIQAIIKLTNALEDELDPELRERVGAAILHTCKNNPFLWDFNMAKLPLIDLMSFHVDSEKETFAGRMKLIKRLLDFGGNEIGDCWAIFHEFKSKKKWLNKDEVSYLLGLVEQELEKEGYTFSRWWLEEIQKSTNCTKATKERIEKVLQFEETDDD